MTPIVSNMNPSGYVDRRLSVKSANTLPRDVSDENYDELSHAQSFLDQGLQNVSLYQLISRVSLSFVAFLVRKLGNHCTVS